MKTAEEVIRSGLPELYVSGTLSSEEKSEVENYILQFPNLKEEIEAIEETIFNYVATYNKTPRAEVKERILKEIKSSTIPDTKVVPISAKPGQSSGGSYSSGWMLAAAIALLLVSSVFNFIFYRNWQNARMDNLALEQSREVLASNLVNMFDSIGDIRQQLAVIQSPEFINVELKGLDPAPQARAVVYWNPQTRESYLIVKNLPPAPTGKQYQLWALAEGSPVDAGIFDLNDNHILKSMKSITAAGGWAITLEPAGGSVNPTLEAMYLYSGG